MPSQRGFSFVELLVVMGTIGLLMGLAIGFLQGIGQATALDEARVAIVEAAHRAIVASHGGRQSIIELRAGPDREMRLAAAVAAPVLTHQFERLDFASGMRAPEVGDVSLAANAGYTGNGARFQGGQLRFAAASSFAMTEGFEAEMWLKPDVGPVQMTLLRGTGEGRTCYELSLRRRAETGAYDVALTLALHPTGASPRDLPLSRTFQTNGGPVRPSGDWIHLMARFDGVDAAIEVDGLPALARPRRPRGVVSPEVEPAEERLRIAIPDSGVVALTISASDRPYRGLMDGFRLRGVFRSAEVERSLPDRLQLRHPALPVKVVYANGRLDPARHDGDVVLVFEDEAQPNDLPLIVTLGMNGIVEAVYDTYEGDSTAAEPGAAAEGGP